MKELQEKLNKKLPKEAIKKHPTKSFLSTIKAIYVTERFTEVFGVGGWKTKVETEHVNHENGMVIVKVIFEVPKYDIYYESYGGNDNGGAGKKGFDLGDAYKGATTDALTKIGSYLGVGIDVFKGLDSSTDKPELNKDHPKWIDAIDSLRTRTITIAGIRKHFILSPSNEEILLNESRNNPILEGGNYNQGDIKTQLKK